jgi:hypothetical protein
VETVYIHLSFMAIPSLSGLPNAHELGVILQVCLSVVSETCCGQRVVQSAALDLGLGDICMCCTLVRLGNTEVQK